MAVNKEFSFCHWASWRRQRGRGLPHNSRKHEMVISLNSHDVPAYKKLLNHWNSPFEDWYESEPARPRSAGGLMAGLVSSVCTNEWMEVIMAAPVWNRSVHFDSVTSPAQALQPIHNHQPYTILTILNTARKEEYVFYVNSRPSLWWLIWYTVISRSWRKLGVSFSPSSRLVMVGLYSLPTQAALTGQCFF